MDFTSVNRIASQSYLNIDNIVEAIRWLATVGETNPTDDRVVEIARSRPRIARLLPRNLVPPMNENIEIHHIAEILHVNLSLAQNLERRALAELAKVGETNPKDDRVVEIATYLLRESTPEVA